MGTCHNHVGKTLPQPQQQPNKPQTTTQHQKQTHHKPPKKMHPQKNPQQQPKQKQRNKINLTQNKLYHFLKIQENLSIKPTNVFKIHSNSQTRLTYTQR